MMSRWAMRRMVRSRMMRRWWWSMVAWSTMRWSMWAGRTRWVMRRHQEWNIFIEFISSCNICI